MPNLDLDERAAARLRERSRMLQYDFADVVLPQLPDVPGMITEYERKYLYWLTSRGYTGTGAVLEVGTWLGCSSIHLGAGLRDSGYDTTLNCVDKYIWNKYFNADHLLHGLTLDDGDDFKPYFEKNVRAVYPNLHVTKCAFEEFAWDGGPIEILFLDAPKELGDFCSALRKFGPYLVPGLSIVVMQDFLFSISYPLAAVVSTLPDKLQLLHAVEHSSTASFAVTGDLTYDLSPPEWDIYAWSPEQTVQAWSRFLEQLAPAPRDFLKPGLAFHLCDLGAIGEAQRVVKEMALGPEGRERWDFIARQPQYVYRYPWLFQDAQGGSPVVFDARNSPPSRAKRIADLERGREWRDRRIAELEKSRQWHAERAAELERGRAWRDQRMAELEKSRQWHAERAAELERGRAWRDRRMAELEKSRQWHAARVAELERGRAWRDQRIAELQRGRQWRDKRIGDLERSLKWYRARLNEEKS